MRPVRLTFAGLRSYRQETTVDFTSLDLFAVIGDTGAGKSTLIEALSLALYGRKSWSGGASMSDLISDGMNTMRIELTFEAGGHQWTVTRARHRNNSAPVDKLVSPTNLGADGAAAVTKRIEEIVGLTHEQFTRAVVLPQGRFDSLLRATEAERNKILASILDLGDVVATRKQAERLLDEWKPKVSAWEAVRATLPADPEAALAAAVAAADAAASLDEQLAAAAVDAARLEAERSRLLDLHAELRSAIDAAPPAPDGAVDALRSLAHEWADVSSRLDAVVAARTEAQAAEASLRERAAALLGGFGSRDALVAGSADVRRVAAELPAALDAVAAARAEADRLAGAAPTADVPADLTAAHQAAIAALDAAERAAAEAERIAAAARATLDRWEATAAEVASCTAALVEAELALTDLDPEVASAADELAAAESAVVDARAAQHAALVADAAATAAAGCGAGDDCPVCARPLPADFEAPAASGDVEAAGAAVAEAERRAKAAAARVATAAQQQASRTASVDHARSAADAARSAELTARQAVDELGLDADRPRPELIAELDAERTAAVERRDAARVTSTAAGDALAEARGKAEGAVAAHQKEVAAASAQVERCEGEVAKLRASLSTLPVSWWDAAVELADDRRSELDALVARLDDASVALSLLDRELTEATQARQAAEVEAATLTSSLDDRIVPAVTRHLAAVDARVRGIAALGAAAESAGRAVGEEVVVIAPERVAALDPADGPDRLAGHLDPLAASLADAEAVERSARALLDSVTVAGTEVKQRLSDVLAPLGCASLAELHQQVGSAQADRRVTAEQAEVARAHAADAARHDALLDIARPFVANLGVLKEALRDVHFVAHLVDAREQELLVEAARRLKEITGGRFGFVSDFGVVDVRSGEVRSPDSLSGGERFQAALALALALVEIASRGGGKLDAVFVDEGFGSLDSRSLDVALETLGHVAGDGKMVALISHLRPVAEYVDTVLHVTKDEMFGSRIALLDGDALETMIEDDTRSGLTV